MPVNLNNVATQDAYADALTVLFARPRPAFTVQIANSSVYYQLAIADPMNPRVPLWEDREHFITPAWFQFRDPAIEGFPDGSHFAGVRFRSGVAGNPARITVM